MSRSSKGFARLVNPGVILSPDLNQKIFEYEAMTAERSDLNQEITRLRKQQEETEDNLAEALAEDEFQCNLRGQQFTGPSEDEQQVILKKPNKI